MLFQPKMRIYKSVAQLKPVTAAALKPESFDPTFFHYYRLVSYCIRNLTEYLLTHFLPLCLCLSLSCLFSFRTHCTLGIQTATLQRQSVLTPPSGTSSHALPLPGELLPQNPASWEETTAITGACCKHPHPHPALSPPVGLKPFPSK